MSPMSRAKSSVFIAESLDGFIARADGAIDWLALVEREGEDYGFAAFFETVDAMVMGRTTYNTVLGFDAWPYGAKRCVVLTHDPPSARHGEEFYAGDVTALAERLGAEGARHVYVDGGEVISQFFAAGLIDEVTVSIIPVVLGDGLRLTRRIGRDVRLELVQHRAFDSGLVRLTYRVA
ncbi:MAG: dihydrofolate reductase [Myxococcales bacterium]|nr:dihydrofolate reductase [Myxococcales bacterium]